MATPTPSYNELAEKALNAWVDSDLTAFHAAFRSVHVTQKSNVVSALARMANRDDRLDDDAIDAMLDATANIPSGTTSRKSVTIGDDTADLIRRTVSDAIRTALKTQFIGEPDELRLSFAIRCHDAALSAVSGVTTGKRTSVTNPATGKTYTVADVMAVGDLVTTSYAGKTYTATVSPNRDGVVGLSVKSGPGKGWHANPSSAVKAVVAATGDFAGKGVPSIAGWDAWMDADGNPIGDRRSA